MHIFAVYTLIDLIEKPPWFDHIQSHLGTGYAPHITLKQPCFIESESISDLKEKMVNLLKRVQIPGHCIKLNFSKGRITKDRPDDICIMLDAEKNAVIDNLQKEILSVLGEYKNYCNPDSENWEKNFQPHLTLASEANEETKSYLLNKIGDDAHGIGLIREITLSIVEQNKPKMANDKKNQTIYKL